MPSQKRASSDNFESAEDSSQRHYQIHQKLSPHERGELEEERREEEEAESKAEAEEVKDGRDEDDDDDHGHGDIDGRDVAGGETEKKDDSVGNLSGEDDKPEFIFVELANIRKDVQCPICLGIIKKTRTVMECLHRFCRECIDKSMRLGNNECPACRTHCASRRSLRDDPNYDALIAVLYPDIDKYEQEELTFHEEEKIRNKQIQESIAQVFQRQEALVKRRPTGTFTVRSNRNNRTWRRRNGRTSEIQESDDNEDGNGNGGKESSSADERGGEGGRQRSGRRQSGGRNMQPSSSLNFDTDENEGNRECRGISPGFGWNPEILAWGKGGARSHTRHGNVGGTNGKNSRGTRLSKLIDYLQRMERDGDDLDIHLMLVSIGEPGMPNLQEPYLSCRPSLSVRHLCEYVALHTTLQAKEVEIVLMEKSHVDAASSHPNNVVLEEKNGLRVLQCDETLAGVRNSFPTSRDPLVLAYRQKPTLTNAS